MAKLTLFHANWCGPCQMFKPVWKKIGETIKEKGLDIEMEDFEHTKNEQMMKEENIESFPTVRITKNGEEPYKYKGTRSVYDILLEVGVEPEKLQSLRQTGGKKNYFEKYLKYKNKIEMIKVNHM